MLDNVRYMICWLPIILTALHFVLDWMGLSHHYTGKPRGHFETFRDGTLHWCGSCSDLSNLAEIGKVFCFSFVVVLLHQLHVGGGGV